MVAAAAPAILATNVRRVSLPAVSELAADPLALLSIRDIS
jgi:hypothetical protein